jgi:hypothetical protein
MSPAWLLMLTLMPVAMIRGAKVLGVFPFPARSHLIVQKALMFELARRGHEVTVVSAIPNNKVIPNYTDIELKTSMKVLMGSAGKGAAGVYISIIHGGIRKICYIHIYFNIVLCEIWRPRIKLANI